MADNVQTTFFSHNSMFVSHEWEEVNAPKAQLTHQVQILMSSIWSSIDEKIQFIKNTIYISHIWYNYVKLEFCIWAGSKLALRFFSLMKEQQIKHQLRLTLD